MKSKKCPKCGATLKYIWLKNSLGKVNKWSCEICQDFYDLDFDVKRQ